MKRKHSIQGYLLLLMILTSFNSYCQYGAIEMKSGDVIEIASQQLHIEGDSLRYFIEKYKPKASFMGIGYKKLKKEMLEKSKLVKIDDIKKVHVDGDLLVAKRSLVKFNAIKYIRTKHSYTEYYVVADGYCRLLVKPDSDYALYSYYLQKDEEDPYKIHEIGTLLGKNFKTNAKKYFENCEPAIDYLQDEKNSTRFSIRNLNKTLKKMVEVYNSNCSK